MALLFFGVTQASTHRFPRQLVHAILTFQPLNYATSAMVNTYGSDQSTKKPGKLFEDLNFMIEGSTYTWFYKLYTRPVQA